MIALVEIGRFQRVYSSRVPKILIGLGCSTPSF